MIDLDAIEGRLNDITPGEWGLSEDGVVIIANDGHYSSTVADLDWGPGRPIEMLDWYLKDADFIAHAPADIAALIAEVKRLQEAVIIYRRTARAFATSLTALTLKTRNHDQPIPNPAD